LIVAGFFDADGVELWHTEIYLRQGQLREPSDWDVAGEWPQLSSICDGHDLRLVDVHCQGGDFDELTQDADFYRCLMPDADVGW